MDCLIFWLKYAQGSFFLWVSLKAYTKQWGADFCFHTSWFPGEGKTTLQWITWFKENHQFPYELVSRWRERACTTLYYLLNNHKFPYELVSPWRERIEFFQCVPCEPESFHTSWFPREGKGKFIYSDYAYEQMSFHTSWFPREGKEDFWSRWRSSTKCFHTSWFPREGKVSDYSEVFGDIQLRFHTSWFPREGKEFVWQGRRGKGFKRRIDATPKIIIHSTETDRKTSAQTYTS